MVKKKSGKKKSINKHKRKHLEVEKKNVEKFKDKKVGEDKRISAEEIKNYSERIEQIKKEIGKAVIGQQDILNGLLRAMLCNGHVLLEGVPGIAKTLIIMALGVVTGSVAKRIQFTVDLLPSDIVGITTYTPEKGMEVIKGPVFANFLIADEINRSPPKCVLGDTPIITSEGEILTIKEIFEKYNGEVAMIKGNEEWTKPKKEIKLLSLDLKDNKIKPEQVKYLYRQKTRNPYHEVILKTGRKIKTSTEHPFFTLRDGIIKTIKVTELKKGDNVLIPRNLNIESNNLLEYDDELVNESREVIKEIIRRKRLYEQVKNSGNNKTIRELINSMNEEDKNLIKTYDKTPPRYIEFEEETLNEYHYSKSKQFGQVSRVKKPVAVTKELARIMAVLIAEGSINKSYVYLTMKEQDIPIMFIKDLEKILELRPKLLYDDKRKQYRVAFRSDAMIKLLKSLGWNPHNKAGSKEIPQFIIKADEEIIKEFLKTYYECDGTVSRDCVKVTTKSEKIANSIAYLLLRKGLVARINHERTKTRIGKYSYDGKFYNLRLYGAELQTFYEMIGFLTKEKNDKLKNLIRSNEKMKTDLIPGMQLLVRQIRKNLGITHKQFYELTGMHAHNIENSNNALMISRSRLKRITNNLLTEDLLLNQLKTILGGDFYCDTIKENNEVKTGKDYYLYDFSMKENHSFIAGFGGIISHNTQSALLEAMQERNVTIGKETYELPKPFFVMATENPLESSGVYFLPEAQVDRFLFKILMDYPKIGEEQQIMKRNMTLVKFEEFKVQAVLTPQEIIKMQELVKDIYLSKEIEKYIVDIVAMTRSKDATEYGKYVELGCSPRASIGIFIASKAEALLNGRNYVIPKDIKKVAYDVMRHRIILNYLAQSEKITAENVIKAILDKVEIP